MDGKQRTTFPKAKLAEIKKRGGIWLAKDIKTSLKLDTDAYEMSLTRAESAAAYEVSQMTTRQLYSFLKDNGYFFDNRAAFWRAEWKEVSR